jgi:hypothetical protein
LEGGPGNDVLDGGDGRDLLLGGPGADTLWIAGPDSVSYSDHREPVVVDLATGGPFGAAGEDDRFEGLPARVIGGAGDDVLTGGAEPDSLDGGGGGDQLRGGGGPDRLNGDAGDDEIFGEAGHDVIETGAGNDIADGGPDRDSIFALESVRSDHSIFRGGGGDDSIEGGAGPDAIDGGPGSDSLYGGLGDDRLTSRDGTRDDVLCGSDVYKPKGSAIVDDHDMTGSCAHVDRPHPARLIVTSHAKTHLRQPTRRLSLGVGCPDDYRPRHCTGRITASAGGHELASGRFDLIPGQTWYAPAITRRPILQKPGSLTVTYVLRSTDARGRLFIAQFRRKYVRARAPQ